MEVKPLNLKNNQITMKEVLANPAAKALLQKRFPLVMKHPLANAAQTLTLAQAIEFARVYVPQTTVNEILRELQKM
jgi:hypothetical protein